MLCTTGLATLQELGKRWAMTDLCRRWQGCDRRTVRGSVGFKPPAPQTSPGRLPAPRDLLDPASAQGTRPGAFTCKPAVSGEAAFSLRARGGAAGRAQPARSRPRSLPGAAGAGPGKTGPGSRAGSCAPLRRNTPPSSVPSPGLRETLSSFSPPDAQ